ncbi:SLC26A11.2 family protein [Megaselia abdita]
MMTDIPGSEDDIYREQLPNFKSLLLRQSKECCSPRSFKNRLPILSWLPTYQWNFLFQDFVAGLTVGLTAIPQSIAYAVVAGLPPQYGLYSAFMSCFIYIFFGSCKDITIGPTAIMALMIQTHVNGYNEDFAILAAFLTGFVIFGMGLLNLGVLVQFISIPVVTGFTTAAAVTIGSGQINPLFGMKSKSNSFINSWEHFFTHFGDIRSNDAILGVLSLLTLLLLRKFKDVKCLPKMLTKYVALSRNALAVIVGILLAYFLTSDGVEPFKLTGKIEAGLPPFKPPPFHTTINGVEYSFTEMVTSLGSSLITIPLISILETVAIAKSFAKGKTVDASQEMVAVGLCNIISSFVQSMPITGSFTRTALNNASGVKTTLGGAVTGILVILTLAFLTSTFYYIPKATLSAIIIAAMIFMVDHERIVEVWKSKKSDMIPFLVTLLACLFLGLEYGMILGIGVNLMFILITSARPYVLFELVKVADMQVLTVEVHSDLKYSAAEYLKDRIFSYVVEHPEIDIVILKGEEIFSIDSTVGLVRFCV